MDSHRALHWYAVATAVATWLLLIAGSLVTSTDSGLAVPDWPLSYGTWFPPMVGGIVYEHGHRMIAGAVGLMILILALWTGRTEPRRWVRRLGYAALGAVFLQALLGGLTVLWLLPPQISIAHACLGQMVFTFVVCLAVCTAPGWAERPPQLTPDASFRRPWLAVAVAILAATQLLLGAVIRHTGRGVLPHLIGAAALTIAVVSLVVSLSSVRRQVPTLWWAGWRLLGLVTLQLGFGAAVFLHRGAVELRTGHVAIGALILAQSVVLAWEVLWLAGTSGVAASVLPASTAASR